MSKLKPFLLIPRHPEFPPSAIVAGPFPLVSEEYRYVKEKFDEINRRAKPKEGKNG